MEIDELLACEACASKLTQTEEVRTALSNRAVVRLRCPECESVRDLILPRHEAQKVREHGTRIARELAQLADEIREGEL